MNKTLVNPLFSKSRKKTAEKNKLNAKWLYFYNN